MPDQSAYFDFEVNINRSDGGYVIRASGMGGRAEARFDEPFTSDQRTIIRQALTNATLRASAKVRSATTEETRQMRDFGETLFNHIFSAEVKDYYYKCWGQAVQESRGLRLRLAVDPSLGDLPWEFLCAGKEFIALNPQTPIVRFVEQPTPISPLKTDLPLHILVVIARPGDQATLDTEAEKGRIAAALQQVQDQGMVEVTYVEGPNTWPRLIDALRPDDIHILHFIGHGAFDEKRGEGVLLMEDSFGDTKHVGSEQLKVLMLGKRHLRLVVLNSCLGTAASDGEPFSSVAAGLVRAGLPAVIAMQFEISDRAARAFAETFYETLAMNLPVDAALTEARREIALTERDSLEWATPVLFMQVADGQLFNLAEAPAAEKRVSTDTIVAEKLLKKADDSFDHQEWERALTYYKLLSMQRPDTERARNRIAVIEKLLETQKKQKSTNSYLREKLTKRADEAFDMQVWDQARTLYKLLLDNNPENDHAKKRLALIDKLQPPAGQSEIVLIDPGKLPLPPTPRTCPHCGKAVPQPAARFCPHCGKTLPAPESGATPAALPPVDLSAKAADRYRAGVAAMAQGRWADAVTAFRGALLFVPNYSDAAQKLAFCEHRQHCASLYDQARKQYDSGNYTQALTSLGQLRNLDPRWPGLADLQSQSECGQQYQQAITQLRQGNKERGAELLRLVIAKRPDFKDAAQRLDNLANGGDGLIASGPVKKEVPSSYRHFAVRGVDLRGLAEELRQYFVKKDFEAQIVEQGAFLIVQGRKEDVLRSLLGMANAATVGLELTPTGFKASVGGGKWLDKAAAATISAALTWGLTFITASLGAYEQATLESALWKIIDDHVAARGGKQVLVT